MCIYIYIYYAAINTAASYLRKLHEEYIKAPKAGSDVHICRGYYICKSIILTVKYLSPLPARSHASMSKFMTE